MWKLIAFTIFVALSLPNICTGYRSTYDRRIKRSSQIDQFMEESIKQISKGTGLREDFVRSAVNSENDFDLYKHNVADYQNNNYRPSYEPTVTYYRDNTPQQNKNSGSIFYDLVKLFGGLARTGRRTFRKRH